MEIVFKILQELWIFPSGGIAVNGEGDTGHCFIFPSKYLNRRKGKRVVIFRA
jgi:hypothetical protein